MTDEIEQTAGEDLGDVSDAPVVTESVKEPIKGHMNYQQWIDAGRDPEEFKGEKAYKKDGELFDALQNQNKKIKTLDDSLTKLAKMYEIADKKGYERGLADLKAQQKAAAEIGDYATVDQISDKMLELNKDALSRENLKPAQIEDLEIKSFLQRNPWYYGTSAEELEMASAADQFDAKLRQRRPDLPVDEHFQIIEKMIKDKFSHRFKAAPVYKPAVEGHSEVSVDISNKNLYQKLPSEHRRIVDDLKKRIPTFDINQYYSDYEELKNRERI